MHRVNASGANLNPFILLFAMSRLVKQKLTIAAPAKLLEQARNAILPAFEADIEVTWDEKLPNDRVQLLNVFGEVEVEIEGIALV